MTKPTAIEKSNLEQKLFGLDHLRFLAIILVFMYHFSRMFPHPEWTNAISKFGWTGVDLFFVLSGYLIARQLFAKIGLQKEIKFKEFFIKRFFRIIPAYLVVVVVYFLFASFHEREALAPLWKYISFTQNLGLDLRSQGTFSHAWSLCIEEQFYLFLPIILLLLVHFNAIKKGFALLLGLFVIGIFIKFYCWNYFVSPFVDKNEYYTQWYKWIYYPTYCRLDGLLIGVSIAAIFQFKPTIRNQIQKYGNLLLLLSLIVLTVAYFVCSDLASFQTTLFGFPLVALGYGLMVTSAISPTSILFSYNSKITTKIATLSYGIYLTHKFIIHLTQENFSKINLAKNSNTMFLMCIITSILAAFALNELIERPFLKLRNKILIQNRPTIKRMNNSVER